jgi:hypothetical protein
MELMGQSEDSVYKKLDALTEQQRNRITDLLNMMGIYTDYTRDARDYEASQASTEWSQSMAEQELGLEKQKFDLDKLISESELALKQQAAAEASAAAAAKQTTSSGSSSTSSSTASSTAAKPSITAAQAKSALDGGTYSQTVLQAYDYYYGTQFSSLVAQLTAGLNIAQASGPSTLVAGTGDVQQEMVALASQYVSKGLPASIVSGVLKMFGINAS